MKRSRFAQFETEEIRYMIDLFGDQHRDSGASALYDEAWVEIKRRAEDSEREAADIYYNGPAAAPAPRGEKT